MVGYLEFLAEEVLFGREVSVESFEFLFLLGKLGMSVRLLRSPMERKSFESLGRGEGQEGNVRCYGLRLGQLDAAA